ncbi:hypothetical protein ACQZ6C_10660 [Rhizobium rhizogenes]
MSLHPKWKDILLRAWSIRFLFITVLAFGLETAFPSISAWWPYAPQGLIALGFLSGGLSAVARVIPQPQTLPGVS